MSERKHINLALQGGGAHGAFTWGVLDRILEDDRLLIDGVSGTSAGAMNGAITVSGHIAGGNEGARKALDRFWESVSALGVLSPIHATWYDRVTGNWDLDNSPASVWLDTLSRVVSPYQTNPLNLSPLGDLLAQLVDFAGLRKGDGIRLFVSATSVNTGKIRVFERKELTLEMLLASAALPNVFQAVEIDGEAYWDGGYMGNPAIFPLIYNCTAHDVVIVQVNPLTREGVPKTAGEIMNRLNEITFNASLISEMRAIAFALKLLDQVPGDVPVVRGLKRMHIHMIEDEPAMESLGVASKLNTDLDFLLYLKRLGRETAERWLERNFDALGERSTIDIRRKFL
ncbi:MAG TPA: patatin-like phospholipase family protein [Stellaceae bacterium]|nr:patatin-like phospholipase family protein [Stellaceae bacterium]